MKPITWGEIVKGFATFFSALFALVGYGLSSFHSSIIERDRERREAEELERAGRGLETKAVEEAATALAQAANFPEPLEYLDHLKARFDKERPPCFEVRAELLAAAVTLYKHEHLYDHQPLAGVIRGEIQEAQYRDYLLKKNTLLADPAGTMGAISDTLAYANEAVKKHFPEIVFTDRESSQTVPLIDLVPNVGQAIFDLTLPFFFPKNIERGIFDSFRQQFEKNVSVASKGSRTLIGPDEHKGTPREIAKLYLANTPFENLFDMPVPFEVPQAKMLEHCMICARTGWGKTQLIQSLVKGWLEQDDPPAIILIDATGAMVRRIQRLALFENKFRNRIIIVDPESDPAPALNMFDTANERLKTYTGAVREEVEGELIELFNYVFGSIARELTGRQSGAFTYIVRLVLSIPGANVHTLRKLLADPAHSYERSEFKPYIDQLDELGQEFFKHFFFKQSFAGTKSAVLERVLALLRVPAFNRMFSTVNKLDMYSAMETGSVVLINASQRLLKETASPLFARYMISRVLAAAFERAAIDEDRRKAAFLIIDEAAPIFDQQLETLLTRVRQYKLGVTIAFQHLDQLDDRLRSAVIGNTSVKYVGGVGFTDARFLARDMGCTPDFIQSLRQSADHTQFACHVTGYTNEGAIKLNIPYGALEAMPTMSDSAHRELLERNRLRITASPEPETKIDMPGRAEPPRVPNTHVHSAGGERY